MKNSSSLDNNIKDSGKILLSGYLIQSRFNYEKNLLLKYGQVLQRIIEKDLELVVNNDLINCLTKDYSFDEKDIDECLYNTTAIISTSNKGSYKKEYENQPSNRKYDTVDANGSLCYDSQKKKSLQPNNKKCLFTSFFKNKKISNNYPDKPKYENGGKSYLFYDKKFHENENPEKSIYISSNYSKIK